jgi:H+/Cl- antiporter ClcA
MEPWQALSYVLLGITLGVIGQLIRVGVGVKKKYDEAESTEKKFNEVFEKDRMFISIVIAVIVGAIAGALGIIEYADEDITREMLITVISFGYAGTDFIEGLLERQK